MQTTEVQVLPHEQGNGNAGRSEAARYWYEQMRDNLGRPTISSLNHLIEAHQREGAWEPVLHILQVRW